MSKLIITFESSPIDEPQPWPVGVDERNRVTSGLGPDDGAVLVGFGPLGENRVDVYAAEVRMRPETAIGLVPTFGKGTLFEWRCRVKEVQVLE